MQICYIFQILTKFFSFFIFLRLSIYKKLLSSSMKNLLFWISEKHIFKWENTFIIFFFWINYVICELIGKFLIWYIIMMIIFTFLWNFVMICFFEFAHFCLPHLYLIVYCKKKSFLWVTLYHSTLEECKQVSIEVRVKRRWNPAV